MSEPSFVRFTTLTEAKFPDLMGVISNFIYYFAMRKMVMTLLFILHWWYLIGRNDADTKSDSFRNRS